MRKNIIHLSQSPKNQEANVAVKIAETVGRDKTINRSPSLFKEYQEEFG